MAKTLTFRQLSSLKRGQLEVTESGDLQRFGQPEPAELNARLNVHDPRFYQRIVVGGDLGAAESFLRGDWSSDDLVTLFRLLARNTSTMQQVGTGLSLVLAPLKTARRLLTQNTRTGSRRNIHAHYDLGNDFFKLFLDPTMTYSSGIFRATDDSMETASIEKYDRICRRLHLTPDDHVVEIGTGWGGFAIHAATRYGCRVTTTTISKEQSKYALERIRAAGLSDRVTVQQKDYRDLNGQYDALVSIEMIEAVGHRFLPTYFRKCESLLRPGGQMMLQAITIPDQRYDQYRRSIDFIQQYIFPGGCLPSLGRMAESLASTRDLRLIQMKDFGQDYAETLGRWRNAFWHRIADVRQLGLDSRFIRMWDYYLAYCEAGFREGMTGVCQLHFVRAR